MHRLEEDAAIGAIILIAQLGRGVVQAAIGSGFEPAAGTALLGNLPFEPSPETRVVG
jgi:hypothetical protein